MPEYLGSGRKDTGRTDEFSDESPRKDYEDYRKKYSKDTAREDMKEDKKIDKQIKSKELCWQELQAHKEAFQETFSSEESNKYYKKLKELRRKWQFTRE